MNLTIYYARFSISTRPWEVILIDVLMITKTSKQPNIHKSRIVYIGGIVTQWNTTQYNGRHFPGTYKCGGILKHHVEWNKLDSGVTAVWFHLCDVYLRTDKTYLRWQKSEW